MGTFELEVQEEWPNDTTSSAHPFSPDRRTEPAAIPCTALRHRLEPLQALEDAERTLVENVRTFELVIQEAGDAPKQSRSR